MARRMPVRSQLLSSASLISSMPILYRDSQFQVSGTVNHGGGKQAEMTECSERNISGTWFGNYYYSDLSQACAFEAVFVQQGASLEGSILDDGSLGEARVTGTFSGGQVSFRKTYFAAGHHPVNYQGLLSDDGKALSGTWRI